MQESHERRVEAVFNRLPPFKCKGDRLNAGETLNQKDFLISNDGQHIAVMQTDGNFVVYDRYHHPTFATGTCGNIAAKQFQLLSDGRVAILNDYPQIVVWSSPHSLEGMCTDEKNPCYIVMQDDGNLVAYRGPHAFWASFTASYSNEGHCSRRECSYECLWHRFTNGLGLPTAENQWPGHPLELISRKRNWIERFKQLFESKALSDVVIQVQEERFDAHKLILSARSSVFLAMFQSDLTETQTDTVKIEGIEPAVFKEVLRFIYTDQVERMEEMAVELLAAAERYMLDFLKEKCASHLATKITVENCAELLLFADLHSAARLKTMVLHFFRSRPTKVAQTASWQQLMQSANPSLLRDVALIQKTTVATQLPASIKFAVKENISFYLTNSQLHLRINQGNLTFIFIIMQECSTCFMWEPSNNGDRIEAMFNRLPPYKCKGDRLNAGETLNQKDFLISQNGRYVAVMQTDGDFVVYDRSHDRTFATGTCDNFAAKQFQLLCDGRVAILNDYPKIVVWSSPHSLGGMCTDEKKPCYIVMQDDGDLVAYRGRLQEKNVFWSSSTAEENCRGIDCISQCNWHRFGRALFALPIGSNLYYGP